jgi:hypothetical protein
MVGIGRPAVGDVKRTHIQLEEGLMTQVSRIFEKDSKLSKLEKRDDTSRIRFLLEEFIRSDGKCVSWYQEERPRLENELSRIKARLDMIEDLVRKS